MAPAEIFPAISMARVTFTRFLLLFAVWPTNALQLHIAATQQAPVLRLGASASSRLLSTRMSVAEPAPPATIWLRQAGAMWMIAALLGPLCDGCHSRHDVLHYATDSIAGAPWLLYGPDGRQLLETMWWVPIAFGGAGLILGVAHPLLDRRWDGGPRAPPGWTSALVNTASFVATYELSGVLAQAAAARGGAHDYLSVDLPLLACAVAIYATFERPQRGGLFMMTLLAIIGPLVEILLINGPHLYAYTHPDVAGIPTWIPWVYAAGGPANGALGRQILHDLQQQQGRDA